MRFESRKLGHRIFLVALARRPLKEKCQWSGVGITSPSGCRHSIDVCIIKRIACRFCNASSFLSEFITSCSGEFLAFDFAAHGQPGARQCDVGGTLLPGENLSFGLRAGALGKAHSSCRGAEQWGPWTLAQPIGNGQHERHDATKNPPGRGRIQNLLPLLLPPKKNDFTHSFWLLVLSVLLYLKGLECGEHGFSYPASAL